jgi:polyisoprenoid-binding protein YceI
MSTTAPEAVQAGTYNVDPSHSNVGFEVRHMGIATVRGSFKTFEGTVDATDGLTLQGAVDVASVNTGDENRDGHLQSPEFFDAAQFPQITFKSTGAHAGADGQLTLNGEITIKGTTKPIELTGALGEGGEDPWGNQRIGFEVEGKIDRREFDLKWNQTLPNGNLLVANDVKLIVSVSAVKAA